MPTPCTSAYFAAFRKSVVPWVKHPDKLFPSTAMFSTASVTLETEGDFAY